MTEPRDHPDWREMARDYDEREAAAGPRASDLRGLTPGLTDGLPSEEYVRRIRDEADKHERCGFTLECPCWTAGATVGPLRKASE